MLNRGQAIVHQDGRILWCSETVREWLAPPRSGSARCCELLSCRDNTVTGEPRCLTRLALQAPERLHARRWRSGRAAAALSAEQLHAFGGPLVIFELQFHDDRATSADECPRARAPGMDLEVRALGPMSVRVGGRSVVGDWLYQRPGELFRYLLAARDKPARADDIGRVLWPELGRAVTNVRYVVFKLREHVDAVHTSGSLILSGAGGYQLDPQRLRLDVDVFERCVTAGLQLYRTRPDADAEERLSVATGLYRGQFLNEDPYAEWAFTERDYLQRLACEALMASAQIALGAGRLVAATERLARLTELEPFNSEAHRLLIEVCLRRGRRTEAFRRYTALSLRLNQTLRQKPDFELAQVSAQVREEEMRARRAAS
jgi:DNA-binding SARP family transcriptional activator